MAKTVLKNAMVIANGTDISNQVSEITIETSRPEIDVTAMGDAYADTQPGIPDATITATVFNDYGVGALDSIFFPLSQSGTPFVVEVRPVNAARSTSNPAYLMTTLL